MVQNPDHVPIGRESGHCRPSSGPPWRRSSCPIRRRRNRVRRRSGGAPRGVRGADGPRPRR